MAAEIVSGVPEPAHVFADDQKGFGAVGGGEELAKEISGRRGRERVLNGGDGGTAGNAELEGIAGGHDEVWVERAEGAEIVGHVWVARGEGVEICGKPEGEC